MGAAADTLAKDVAIRAARTSRGCLARAVTLVTHKAQREVAGFREEIEFLLPSRQEFIASPGPSAREVAVAALHNIKGAFHNARTSSPRSLWRWFQEYFGIGIRFARMVDFAPAAPVGAPAPPPPSEAKAPPTPVDVSILSAVPAKGAPPTPAELEALAPLLVKDITLNDLQALDLLSLRANLSQCNPKSRVLLAVAYNLSRRFGLPSALPLAAVYVWRKLDGEFYQAEMADILAMICDFVLTWQTQKDEFLVLDMASVELVEYLFEQLHPRRHGILLAKVMQFKVLSARRIGLLRRLPNRAAARIKALAHQNRDAALEYAGDMLALLSHIGTTSGFPPIIEAAKAAAEQITALTTTLHGSPQTEPTTLALAPPRASETASAPALPTPAKRRRLTPVAKTAAVLRVLRGEAEDQVATTIGVSQATLTKWVGDFVRGGSGAPGRAEVELKVLKASIDDLAAQIARLTASVSALAPPADKPALALPAPRGVITPAPTERLVSPAHYPQMGIGAETRTSLD